MANVVLIATGGIRAPRQVELARAFLARGHRVRCVNSRSSYLLLVPHLLRHPRMAITFLRTMHSPLSELWSYVFAGWTGNVAHVRTSRWADVMVIAPATCNTIGKIANGITDSFALLIVRAFERGKKVVVAPSMNPEMWIDPCNQENIRKVEASGKYVLVRPVEGRSVSGEVGLGMMAPLDQVVEEALRCVQSTPGPAHRPT